VTDSCELLPRGLLGECGRGRCVHEVCTPPATSRLTRLGTIPGTSIIELSGRFGIAGDVYAAVSDDGMFSVYALVRIDDTSREVSSPLRDRLRDAVDERVELANSDDETAAKRGCWRVDRRYRRSRVGRNGRPAFFRPDRGSSPRGDGRRLDRQHQGTDRWLLAN
jgi:hypothetical protein